MIEKLKPLQIGDGVFIETAVEAKIINEIIESINRLETVVNRLEDHDRENAAKIYSLQINGINGSAYTAGEPKQNSA
jgi:Cu/Ag efflux pump CusA